MADQKIAQQIDYQSLSDFIEGSNNFYLHFLDDCVVSNRVYRQRSYFKRFQEQHPKREQEVTRATVQARRAEPRQDLPYEQLWEAYKIMSKLVFLDDKYVIRDGQPDTWFLCR